MKLFIILLTFFFSGIMYGQNTVIDVSVGKFILDENLKLIICNNDISSYTDLSANNSITLTIDAQNYIFTTIPDQLVYGTAYLVEKNGEEFKLYFSNLPLINITASQEIVDEPKVAASFVFTDTTNAAAITSDCGIEYRGGISQTYPKKSYSIEFWTNPTGNTTQKLSFLNMRNDDDWILLAMYKEPLKIRSVANLNLWREIHTPYYIDREPDAKATIRTKYVELAVNNEYLGIYALGEKVDKKQLKLKKYNNAIRGELYKGKDRREGTSFYDLPPYDNQLPQYDNTLRLWSGYEYKYPKESDITDWSNLYNFVDFVIYAQGTVFQQNISSKFNIENAVDYFIFLNLLSAYDNRGKNLYLAKYKENEPYFYVPWDLDGTLGMEPTGEQNAIYDEILVIGLYTRLLNSANAVFKTQASERWAALRATTLEENNLKNTLSDTYNFLLSNGNYEREVLKWGQESVDLTNLNYTFQWLDNRLAFLDNYFGHTILNTNLFLNNVSDIEVSPNPVEDSFKIISSKSYFTYKIYNLNGSLIKKGINTTENAINITDFPSGIYFLRLIDKHQKRYTFKLLKK